MSWVNLACEGRPSLFYTKKKKKAEKSLFCAKLLCSAGVYLWQLRSQKEFWVISMSKPSAADLCQCCHSIRYWCCSVKASGFSHGQHFFICEHQVTQTLWPLVSICNKIWLL